MAIETYCLAIENGEEIDPNLVTPIQTSEMLTEIGNGVLANVAKDIEVAKTWKIRPLPATYVVPSKGEFFSSGSSSNSDGDSGNK